MTLGEGVAFKEGERGGGHQHFVRVSKKPREQHLFHVDKWGEVRPPEH